MAARTGPVTGGLVWPSWVSGFSLRVQYIRFRLTVWACLAFLSFRVLSWGLLHRV